MGLHLRVLVYASLGLCLQVWAYVCKSGRALAGLGLCLQVWGYICRSGLLVAGLGLHLVYAQARLGIPGSRVNMGRKPRDPVGQGSRVRPGPWPPPASTACDPGPPSAGETGRNRAGSGLVFACPALYLQVLVYICKCGLAFASLGLHLHVWLVFASLGLYLQVCACICSYYFSENDMKGLHI